MYSKIKLFQTSSSTFQIPTCRIHPSSRIFHALYFKLNMSRHTSHSFSFRHNMFSVAPFRSWRPRVHIVPYIFAILRKYGSIIFFWLNWNLYEKTIWFFGSVEIIENGLGIDRSRQVGIHERRRTPMAECNKLCHIEKDRGQ